MKVLHIFERLTIGGAETLILNVTKHLNSESIQFDFLVHSDDVGEYELKFQDYGCKIIRNSISRNGLKMYIKKNKELFQQYDIIHCHVRKYAFFDLPIAKHLGKTTILHCHSASSKDKKSKSNLLMFFYKRYLNKYTDYAFTCSLEAKKFLFSNKSKTINIKNGIDHTDFKFDYKTRTNIRKKLNIADDELVIGHVGSFREVKNHKFIIDVANELTKKNILFKVVLIGAGELKEDIENYALNKGVMDNIIFVGNIFNVNQYLSAFDIFLFPSLYEGLPLSVIEAQINGLYVLCSKFVDPSVKIVDNFDWIDIESTEDVLNDVVNRVMSYQSKERSIEISKFDICETVAFLNYFYENIL